MSPTNDGDELADHEVSDSDVSQPRPPLEQLLDAADRGDVEMVRDVLDADPTLLNERGLLHGHTGLRTALHFAVNGPHEDVVALLLDRGADPNIRDEGDDVYALHFAAEKGGLAVVRLLVEHGADTIGAGTFHALNVLGWATVFGDGHPELVEYLLEHGAQHTIESAVASGHVEVIRGLVGASPELLHARLDATSKRRTPLHLAVVTRQFQSLATLLELGADSDAVDAANLTPLDQAALSGDVEMVELLLEAGATVQLPAAVALEYVDDVEALLAADPTLLHPGERYGALLTQACERASGDIVRLLVAAGANVNTPASAETAIDGAAGYTALHAAAFFGNTSAVDALLEAGADVRAREQRHGGTPAGWARYAGHSDVCGRILAGDIDIFDAIEFDQLDRIAFIIEADPDALTRPFDEYVSWTLGESTDTYSAGTTPLDAAIQHERTEAERILRSLGA